jgi:hypothetical protein
VIYVIHGKNVCKYSNVPPPSTTIKKLRWSGIVMSVSVIVFIMVMSVIPATWEEESAGSWLEASLYKQLVRFHFNT